MIRDAYRTFDEAMAPFIPLLILYLIIYAVVAVLNITGIVT